VQIRSPCLQVVAKPADKTMAGALGQYLSNLLKTNGPLPNGFDAR
jgi:hypothetical protein